MQNVTLIFPDLDELANFIFTCEVGSITVNTVDCMLTGVLEQGLIDKACKDYNAVLLNGEMETLFKSFISDSSYRASKSSTFLLRR
jgi:hypothetical protein